MKNGSRYLSDRRRALRILALSPLLAAAVAVFGEPSVAQAKRSKEEANYQPSPKDGEQCSRCTHFVEGGECRIVAGEISPEGWCRFWVER